MKAKRRISAVVFILFLSVSGIIVDAQTVIISTTKGDIEVELYGDRAPVTVKNFLMYVDSGLFKMATFYRVVTMQNQPNDSIRIEVVQGGRRNNPVRGFPPIIHENTSQTGILHKDGVISMARNSVGTATSEFSICVGDQPSLDYGGMRNRDGQGFAAFGKVISGMDVVRSIQKGEVEGQYLVEPVIIKNITRK